MLYCFLYHSAFFFIVYSYFIILLFFFFFFFSSRRRHTRSLCDWSSDVCSSDLRSAISSSRRSASWRAISRSRCSFMDELDGASSLSPLERHGVVGPPGLEPGTNGL